jgi:predicted nucleotidyltransferase component of viral defense system
MSKISEAALKDRIKNLAAEKGTTVTDLLKKLYLERFLARLGRSDYSDKLIFKGGNLLGYYLEIGRQTIDLDFLLTKIKAEEPSVKKTFEDIAGTKSDDGFAMSFVRIENLEQAHMNYPGFRVILNIKLVDGKLTDNLQIDVGVGDKVEPEKQKIELLAYRNAPLFEESVSLLVYPAESIYAEKLETVASKGSINSRMKDFHDLILMGREPGLLDKELLGESIVDTFQHRGTALDLPIKFDDAQFTTMNNYWSAHGSTMGAWWVEHKMPEHFKQAVLEINHFLGTVDMPKKDGKG